MVVKVVKTEPLQLVCGGCKATLEFAIDDLVPMRVNGDYTEAGDPAVGVLCPSCKSRVVFKGASSATIEMVHNRKS